MEPRAFTGICDIDRYIFLQLDEISVRAVGCVNKYTNSICNDTFWKLKIHDLYPEFPMKDYSGSIRELYRELTKQLYNQLKCHIPSWDKCHHSQLKNNSVWITNWKYQSLHNLYWAAKHGYLELFKWFCKFYNQKPITAYADAAAEYNRLEILEYLSERNIYPTTSGLKSAAKNGHMTVLKWASTHNLYPDQSGADAAAYFNQLEILRWLIDHKIYPSQTGVNDTTAEGRWNILEYIEQTCNLRPNQEVSKWAISHNKLDVLQWVISHRLQSTKRDLDPYFNQHAIDLAAGYGYLEILQYIFHEVDLLPTQKGINLAAKHGRLDILQWMSNLEHPLFPNKTGIKWARKKNQYKVLEWLNAH